MVDKERSIFNSKMSLELQYNSLTKIAREHVNANMHVVSE
jgi:hypothetical protein